MKFYLHCITSSVCHFRYMHSHKSWVCLYMEDVSQWTVYFIHARKWSLTLFIVKYQMYPFIINCLPLVHARPTCSHIWVLWCTLCCDFGIFHLALPLLQHHPVHIENNTTIFVIITSFNTTVSNYQAFIRSQSTHCDAA